MGLPHAGHDAPSREGMASGATTIRAMPFVSTGRTKWYTAPDEIPRDLDIFMAFYNFRHTYQGYRVAGRLPAKDLYDLISEQ